MWPGHNASIASDRAASRDLGEQRYRAQRHRDGRRDHARHPLRAPSCGALHGTTRSNDNCTRLVSVQNKTM